MGFECVGETGPGVQRPGAASRSTGRGWPPQVSRGAAISTGARPPSRYYMIISGSFGQSHEVPLTEKLVGEVSLVVQVPWKPREVVAPGLMVAL
jgi:hypothetical protein